MPEAPPSVGVVMICYNGEAFIAAAIESVLSQTFQSWELVVADDGSTDASREIVEKYRAEHPDRIRLVRHPDGGNHGMSATRNLGASTCGGEYLAFLDCDDVWLPEKLAEQVALLNQHASAGMVYGRTLIWNSWDGKAASEDFFYDLGVSPGRLYAPPSLLLVLLENAAQTPTTCNAIVRRSVFKRVGGFEPSFRGMFEDQVFFGKVLLETPTYVAEQCWAKYRQHPTSHSALSAQGNGDWRSRLRFLGWFGRYALRTSAGRVEVLAAVAREVAVSVIRQATRTAKGAARKWLA